jgi:hypothetical protein
MDFVCELQRRRNSRSSEVWIKSRALITEDMCQRIVESGRPTIQEKGGVVVEGCQPPEAPKSGVDLRR